MKWIAVGALFGLLSAIGSQFAYEQAEFNSRIKIIDQNHKAQVAFNAEDRYGFDDEPLKPVPETELPPPPAESQSLGNSAPLIADAQPVASDTRPVIVVDTLHDGLHSHDKRHRRLCEPCDAFHDWHAREGDAFPLRFDVRAHANVNEIPRDVLGYGTPLFRLKGADGQWWPVSGWTGPEKVLAEYVLRNPGFTKVPLVAAPVGNLSGNPVELLRKFGGEEGTVTFSPKKHVGQYVNDSTFLAFDKVTISYKITGKDATFQFVEPRPEATVKVFGIWWTAQLIKGSTNMSANPPTVKIQHSKGEKVFEIRELVP